MSYTIKAVLSNDQHPEYGQMTISFPIPNDQYDQTIEMLQTMELGFSRNRDCRVDDLDSSYSVLRALTDTMVNVDQLDYLAKRLDSFVESEAAQFQAMAHRLDLAYIKDLINLTFCCQRATVITDFSDLEAIGRAHYMNLHDGCAASEELADLDGHETALLLIDSGAGTVTPYGVAYDNGMKLEQVYNGRQFPAYLHDNCVMMLEITPKHCLKEDQNPEYLYLPASEHQIERTLLRVGMTTPADAKMRLEFDELPEKMSAALNLEALSGDDLPDLNRLCRAIKTMTDTDVEKLSAVVQMACPQSVSEMCQLAENLDQFEFVPGVHTPEEYGRHMIQQSGHYEYDENLENFYDYRLYGESHVQAERGAFNECGYVAYLGTLPLDELMRDEPAQHQQGPQMGGIV